MPAAAQAACDAYNEAAKVHGWTVCAALTPPRAKRLEGRLRDIGGLEAFKRALSAIPRDDFLMGRKPPRPGEPPFKLGLARLLQTDGNMGDVLAGLIDAAGDAAPPGGGPIKLPDCRNNPDLTRRFLKRLSPNGPWPANWALPGSADCVFHRGVLGELGFLSSTSADT